MRTTRIVLLTAACGLLAWPLLADKKLDDAVAKAEDQIAKGKVDEAAKTIQKMLQPPTAEGHVAAARLQVRMGKYEEAAATAAAGVQAAGATPEAKSAALASLSSLDLLRSSGLEALKHAQEAVAASPTPAALAALARAQVRTGDAAGAVANADKAVAAGSNGGHAGGAGTGAAGERQGRRGAGRVRQGARGRSQADGRPHRHGARAARAEQGGRGGRRGEEGGRGERERRRGARRARDRAARAGQLERRDRRGPGGPVQERAQRDGAVRRREDLRGPEVQQPPAGRRRVQGDRGDRPRLRAEQARGHHQPGAAAEVRRGARAR